MKKRSKVFYFVLVAILLCMEMSGAFNKVLASEKEQSDEVFDADENSSDIDAETESEKTIQEEIVPGRTPEYDKTYTVLIVDASEGYSFNFTNYGLILSLTPRKYKVACSVEETKEAARKIIPQLMAYENSYVAIVSYSKTAETVTDFTNNQDDAFATLDSIEMGVGSGNIESGLKTAAQLLDSVEGNKRIFLCTSGCSINGNNSETGVYSPDDSSVPSIWVNADTDILLYQYANSLISTAQSIRDKNILISVVGIFSPIENSLPSDGKILANFFRRVAKDIASSEDLFYTVEELDKLGGAFEQYVLDVVEADYFSYYKAVKYNDHTYRLFDSSISWQSAAAYCESIGGHLVTITSPEEEQVVNNLLDSKNNTNNVWIGASTPYFISQANELTDSEIISKAKWITYESVSYNNFAIETRNRLIPDNYGYVSYIDSDSKQWMLIPNSVENNTKNEMSFVCEWDNVYKSMFEKPNLVTMSKKYLHTCGDKGKEVYLNFSWGTDLFDNGVMGSALRMPDYDLAIASLLLSQYAYDDDASGEIYMFMKELGFKSPYYSSASLYEPKTYYGYQKVTFRDGRTANLFLVDSRGTKDTIDLLSDADGLDGFFVSVQFAKENLQTYMETVSGKSIEELNNEENIFWLTGHSYGAAVINRLSVLLSNRYGKGNVYTYTFESPHTAYVAEGNIKSLTNSVNYINVDDWVTHMGLGQSTYGNNIHFSQNTDLDNEIFKYVTGGSGMESINDVDSVNANHNLDLPLTYILKQKMLMEKKSISDYVRYLVEIECPVDVRLISNNNVIGEIKNDKLVMKDTTYPIELFVVGNKKYILLDENADIDIEIEAYNKGTMDFNVIKEDYSKGTQTIEKGISNIQLEKNQTFNTSINTSAKADSDLSNSIVLETTKDDGIYEILTNGTARLVKRNVVNLPEIPAIDTTEEESKYINDKLILISLSVLGGFLVLVIGRIIYKKKRSSN